MSLKTNIAVIVDKLEPESGMEKAASTLISNLAERDRLSEVLVLRGEAELALRVEGVTFHFLKVKPGIRGRLRARRQLKKRISAMDASTTTIAVGAWAFLTCAYAGGKNLILWEHSLLNWRVIREPGISLLAVLLTLYRRRVAHWVSVGRASAELGRKIVKSSTPVAVIPNPLSASAIKRHELTSEMDGRSLKLVGIGSLIPRKNWELAITAMQWMPPDTSLTIYGQGRSHSRLVKLVNALNLSSRVTLAGHVPGASEHLSPGSVLVHPSWAETYGYAMAEATDLGVPVVAIRMPVMDEYVGELFPGELADPRPEDFARACLMAAKTSYDFVAARQSLEAACSPVAVTDSWLDLIDNVD